MAGLSTPSESPAVLGDFDPPPPSVSGLRAAVRRLGRAWLEPQDPAGVATVSVFVLSGVSCAGALAVTLKLVPFDAAAWTAAAWFFHRFSDLLWAAPVALGLASRRPLPRCLAGFSVGLAVLYYGWDWLPVQQSPSILVKGLYVAIAAVVALPSLVAQVRNRRPRAAGLPPYRANQ